MTDLRLLTALLLATASLTAALSRLLLTAAVAFGSTRLVRATFGSASAITSTALARHFEFLFHF